MIWLLLCNFMCVLLAVIFVKNMMQAKVGFSPEILSSVAKLIIHEQIAPHWGMGHLH